MTSYFVLNHDTARQRAQEAIKAAPDGHVVQIKEPTRNLEQSAKFHAICSDCSKHLLFAGHKRTPEQWKMLLISGHSIATKQGSEMCPGIEGEWVNLRESSAAMSKKRMCSLIEYATAFYEMNPIKVNQS
jgi:hypothetical protein